MASSKFSVSHKDEPILELTRNSDHKTLAVWAIDCVERVLPYFGEKFPEDGRPRNAIEASGVGSASTCLNWSVTE
ncbi:MAG: putative immunity protein [Candidatus Promineifilaceae bacterium]